MKVIQDASIGWLTVNRACDNRCDWCYAQNSCYGAEVLNRENAHALVNLMADIEIKNIALIGGEPTLYKDLFYVTNLIHQKGIESSMTTHGKRFANKEYAKELANTGMENITVSVKGINREKYLKLTRVDGFDEMCAGINNLQQLGLNPGVFYTMGLTALQEVDDTLNFLRSLGTKIITISFANPVILNGKACNKDTPDPLQIAQAYSRIIQLIEGAKQEIFVSLSIPLCLLTKEARAIAIKRKVHTGTCYARAGAGVAFSPTGEVIPCHHFMDSTMGKLGVDFHDAASFLEFWQREASQEFRQIMNYYPSEECQGCIDWQHCFGGCPIKWFYFNPKNFIKKGGDV
ncbi:MAG: radical SAM protein [Candidatus Moraniibacteriota bacterium]